MKKITTLIVLSWIGSLVWSQTEDLSINHRWYTHNTSSTNAGKWTKIAECQVTAAYQDFGTTFELYANSGGDSRMYYGKLVTRFKNQNSTAKPVNFAKLVLLNSNIDPNNIKAVRNDVKVEVYIKIPPSHTRFYYRPIVNGASAMTPLLTQNFHNELPQGDLVIDCETGESNFKEFNLNSLKVLNELEVGETTLNKIQLATYSWSGSHGILFNSYKDVYQNGWLAKNTRYANNVGSYGSGAGAIFFYGNGGTMDFCISPNSTGKDDPVDWGDPKLRIYRNGNIAIGKSSADAKLDVAGNIKAHEIEVTLASINDMQLNGTLAANNITYTPNGNTADFVFEDNYYLKDLSEVEAFIKANKHLPEIPSAAEMEEAGVNLAEMNKLLLMKVEELTLYAIEKDKEVESLEFKVVELMENRRRVTKEIEKVREDRRAFEERLEILESLLIK